MIKEQRRRMRKMRKMRKNDLADAGSVVIRSAVSRDQTNRCI